MGIAPTETPAGRVVMVAGRHRPETVDVIREDNPAVYLEGIFPADTGHGVPEQINLPDQPVIGITLKKIDGEEVATARDLAAAIAGHGG
nr:hypothetical protein [Gammaproteobacteria bacterium]